MRYALASATLAALVISGSAFAQMSGAATQGPAISNDPQQAYAPPQASGGRYGEPYLARPLPNGAMMDPSGRVQTDRFGNVVRGDSCASNPANCAYDPSRTAQTQ